MNSQKPQATTTRGGRISEMALRYKFVLNESFRITTDEMTRLDLLPPILPNNNTTKKLLINSLLLQSAVLTGGLITYFILCVLEQRLTY